MPKFLKKQFDKRQNIKRDPNEPIPRLWPVLRSELITLVIGLFSAGAMIQATILIALTGDLLFTVLCFGSFILNAVVLKAQFERIAKVVSAFDEAAISMDKVITSVQKHIREQDPDFDKKVEAKMHELKEKKSTNHEA